MGLPAKLLVPGEREVMSVRTHWKSLVAPVVLLFAVTAFGSFCAALVPDGPYRYGARVAIAIAGGLVVLRLSVWPFLQWLTTTYTLTDRRLVNRSGVLRRTGRDIPLRRISDVVYERTLSDRLFGCGTLVVSTANDAGETLIDDIPHVGEFHLAMTSLLLGEAEEQDRRVRYSGRRDDVPPPPRDNHYRSGRPVQPAWGETDADAADTWAGAGTDAADTWAGDDSYTRRGDPYGADAEPTRIDPVGAHPAGRARRRRR